MTEKEIKQIAAKIYQDFRLKEHGFDFNRDLEIVQLSDLKLIMDDGDEYETFWSIHFRIMQEFDYCDYDIRFFCSDSGTVLLSDVVYARSVPQRVSIDSEGKYFLSADLKFSEKMESCV